MRKILTCLALAALVKTALAKNTQTFNFQHDGLTLHGRIQIPDGTGPFRTIVINPGTGANDRDGTIQMMGGNTNCLYPGLNGSTLKPYLGLSEALSDSGYAVVTYDKVEFTYVNPGVISFHKLWLPVESLLSYLKTRNDIDTSEIILLGHSEGSTLIPYIARKNPHVKTLISLAGPRTPLDSILAYQLKYIAQTCGQDTSLANDQADEILQYFNLIRSGSWPVGTPPFAGVPPAVWKDYMDVADSVSINYNLANKKTLFVGLGADFNVPISTELSRFQNEISVPADFYQLNGLNHFLTTGNNPVTSKMLTDTLIYWLKQHTPPLSVKDLKKETERFSIQVGNGKIKVSSREETVKKLVLLDMTGRKVFTANGRYPSLMADISNLASGIYVVFVQGNKTVQKQKIIL